MLLVSILCKSDFEFADFYIYMANQFKGIIMLFLKAVVKISHVRLFTNGPGLHQ